MRARSGGTEGQRWWGGGTAARMSRAPPRRLHIRRTRAAASPPRTAPPRRHHVRHHLCASPLRRAVADSHPKSDHRVLLAWCTTRLPAAVRHGESETKWYNEVVLSVAPGDWWRGPSHPVQLWMSNCIGATSSTSSPVSSGASSSTTGSARPTSSKVWLCLSVPSFLMILLL